MDANALGQSALDLLRHMARDRFRAWVDAIKGGRFVQVGGLKGLQDFIESLLESVKVESKFVRVEVVCCHGEIHLPIVPMQHLALTAQEQRVRRRKDPPDLQFEHESEYREAGLKVRTTKAH